MNIMIADDHKTSQLILSKGLRQLGFDTLIVANNGREVLEKLPGSGIDLLFLDWHMPELDGLETLKKVRAIPEFAKLPIIMVTSEAHTENIKLAALAGVNQYLVKPIDFKRLSEKLEYAIQHYQGLNGESAKGINYQHPVALLAAFMTSTADTLTSLTSLTIRAGDIQRKQTTKQADICSVIGLAGNISGAAVMVFSQGLATKIVAAMLGESSPSQEMIQDGIEEIMNMIAGRARAEVEKTDYAFNISLVTTVCGHEQIARPGKKCCQIWSIPFYMEEDECTLELRIADKK